MPNEQELERLGREALKRYFADAGLPAKWVSQPARPGGRFPDQLIEVRLPNGKRGQVIVEFKANPRNAPIQSAVSQLRHHAANAKGSEVFPLIFSWHFGRPMRKWLREQKLWFADISGNRFFKAPGLFVDREVIEKAAAIPKLQPSLFADRSSLILRYLLPRPPEKLGVRELARKLGLSQAAVSVGLRRLADLGYLEHRASKLHLLDRESLLEEWVSFYRPRFRQQRQSRYYVHARSAEAIIALLRSHKSSRRQYALSLHAGASLVAPFVQFQEVHIYPEPGPKQIGLLLRSLGAKHADSEANFVVLDPFYRSSVDFDCQVRRGVRVVSDLQLYLDLRCFSQRGLEQAEVLLERRLRPAWSAK
jgi:DNA-binding transcriptional ArsR family regulator